jgi:hypothetical protein
MRRPRRLARSPLASSTLMTATGAGKRIIAGIDDGTYRAAFRPLTDSFIKAPDDTFIDEG